MHLQPQLRASVVMWERSPLRLRTWMPGGLQAVALTAADVVQTTIAGAAQAAGAAVGVVAAGLVAAVYTLSGVVPALGGIHVDAARVSAALTASTLTQTVCVAPFSYGPGSTGTGTVSAGLTAAGLTQTVSVAPSSYGPGPATLSAGLTAAVLTHV